MIEIISTVVITIATVTLVFVTWQYAKATKRYAETMEKALKAADTPDVKVYLSHNSYAANVYALDLCIHNIGTGFAYNVTFAGDFLSLRPQFDNTSLTERSIIKNGISLFAPGTQSQITLFFQYQQSDLPQRTFNAVVKYWDSAGEEHNGEFLLDFNKVEDYPQIADPSLHSIASSLRFIYGHFLDLNKKRDNQNQQR